MCPSGGAGACHNPDPELGSTSVTKLQRRGRQHGSFSKHYLAFECKYPRRPILSKSLSQPFLECNLHSVFDSQNFGFCQWSVLRMILTYTVLKAPLTLEGDIWSPLFSFSS